MGPIITALPGDGRRGPTIPFVGLVEAMVVQAFRETGLPLQRIRRALWVLSDQGALAHPLASRHLYTDGAQVLFDYAMAAGAKDLRLLTVAESGQRVFREVIADYLRHITYGDEWATGLDLPLTDRCVLRVDPDVASGDPLFIRGGAPWSAVASRWQAGEQIESIAADCGVPTADIGDALGAVIASAA